MNKILLYLNIPKNKFYLPLFYILSTFLVIISVNGLVKAETFKWNELNYLISGVFGVYLLRVGNKLCSKTNS